MSLDKINLLYTGKEPRFYRKSHYDFFADALQKHLKYHNNFRITHDWENLQENSLILAYDYEGIHEDLANLAQQDAHEFYRRIFLINWQRFGHPENPTYYRPKCFAGNLISRAYDVIMGEGTASIDYDDFYGDSFALDNLRMGADKPDSQWRVSRAYEVGLYESVYCGIDILQVLAIYLEEYMEKYDRLKLLNPQATNHANFYQSAIDILDEHSLDMEKPNDFAIKLANLLTYITDKGGGSKLSNEDVSEIFTNYTMEEIALCVSQYTEDVFEVDSLFLRGRVFPGDRMRLTLVKLMAYAYNINKNITLDEYPAYIKKMQAQIKTPEDLKEIKFDFPKIYSFVAQKAYKLKRVLEKDLLGNSEDGLLGSALSE